MMIVKKLFCIKINNLIRTKAVKCKYKCSRLKSQMEITWFQYLIRNKN